MIITTGFDPIPQVVARARELADRTGCAYAPRAKFSMGKLVEHYGDEQILVVLQEAVRLITPGMPPMEFHPSMGFVRAKRILRGEPDPMIDAAGMLPGDSVLDCTAGLGADSLLFAVTGGDLQGDGTGELAAVVCSPAGRDERVCVRPAEGERGAAPY